MPCSRSNGGSSATGRHGYAFRAPYSGFMQNLAKELGLHTIRMNAILPGSSRARAMVLFLPSPMGDNLSGRSLGVDGNVEALWEP
jgi:NAD(P)-dependent dehydrogenase (short-subunit alcohol dehydrogenase family)